MYVLDHKRQISLIREMIQLRKDNEKWEAYYHHPSTNVMWKSYFPKANDHDRGPKILRTEPVPVQLEEWLESCLIDADPEDARGLGIELSITPQNWDQLMEIIEANYRQYSRKQLSLFLACLGIEHYQALFDEMNYSLQNVGLEKEDMEKLARRSKIVRFKRFWFF